MARFAERTSGRGGIDRWSRVAMAAALGLSTSAFPAPAQTPPVPEQAPLAAASAPVPDGPAYTLSELEYIFGPVALYPDPLLAVLLPATLFPEEIVAAYNWIEANPRFVQARNFARVDDENWDSSVKALARFPDVVRLLHDNMEWTESIGLAFSSQPQDVSNTIQMLRAKAESVGNLKTTPQQVVTTRDEGGQRTILIAPSNPERVYVPVYDSSTVFATAATTALLFGSAVLVGSAWNNRWGWNNRGWNTVWVTPPNWHRPPHWGPGWGHRPPPAWGPGPWRPDRPDRPGAGRPGSTDRPGAGPDRPNWPNRPGLRPDRPGAGADRPNLPSLPNRPDGRPDRPGAGADRPASSNRPTVRPDRRGTEASRPASRERPNAGVHRPNRPAAAPNRPNRSNATPNRPRVEQSRPNRPSNVNRPAQNARPAQNVRPQSRTPPQHRSRPQSNGGRRGN